MPSKVGPPDSRNSPSPSPPADPPTSSAPGPRARALKGMFDQALSHTLGKCTYENFASCFPTPAKHVPEALNGLHRDFVTRLDEMCRSEFASLLEERDAVASLNQLDILIADARRRKEKAVSASVEQGGTPMQPLTPPHLLPPEAILNAHLSPFLAEQASNNSARVLATQKRNQNLADEILAQRRELDGLVRTLEDAVQDLEEGSTVLNQDQLRGVDEDLVKYAADYQP